MRIEPVTAQQAQIARQAYRDFGKGRHKAALNFDDCFAYALAMDLDEPLLCKGAISGTPTSRRRSNDGVLDASRSQS